MSQGTQDVTEYLNSMKAVADELTMAQNPVLEDDLVVNILNGLSPEFQGISTVIRARESPITIEELTDKLVDFGGVLNQANANSAPIVANLAQQNKKTSPQKGNYQCNSYNNNRSYNYMGKNNGGSNMPWCPLCGKPGHSAKTCRQYKIIATQEPTANFVTKQGNSSNQYWVMDSGATHHVTNDLQNLSFYSEYDGEEDRSSLS